MSEQAKRYLLHTAIITGPGLYRYQFLGLKEAREWIKANSPESYISPRYRETAQALEALTGYKVAVRSDLINLQPGDAALVFRLTVPSPDRRRAARRLITEARRKPDHLPEDTAGLVRAIARARRNAWTGKNRWRR